MTSSVTMKRRAKAVLRRDVIIRPSMPLSVEQHGVGYGAWHVWPEELGEESVVYSIGVGEDVSFDLSLIRTYGVEVWALDPTPRSIQWIRSRALPRGFHFSPVGVADYDGSASFEPPTAAGHVSYAITTKTLGDSVEAPVRRLATLAEERHHASIDLLKLDVEGAEYPVIADLCENGPPVRQLLVEFHHGRFGIRPRATKEAVARLAAAGYRLFHVSRTGAEYAFLRSADPFSPARRSRGETLAAERS